MATPGAPKLEVDAAGLDSFHSWYKTLPQVRTIHQLASQSSSTHTTISNSPRLQDAHIVRIFDRKTCYSVHGEPAFMVARYLYRTTAQVTYIGGQANGLPGITISYNLFPGLLRELLVERAEYSVEVYEGAGSCWRCVKRGSPGVWRDFEADLNKGGDLSDAPIIASIVLGQVEGVRTVGFAFCDVTGRRLGACEFADDEHYCQLEAALTQLGVREAVCIKDHHPQHQDTTTTAAAATVSKADKAHFADVLTRCGALPAPRPRPLFSPKSLPQDLGRLLRGGPESLESHRPILDKSLASSALAGVVAFSELLADDANHSKFTLQVYSTGKYMRIDAAAQRALNILRSRTDATDSFSLYGLLNRGKTAGGKRLLKTWLKQPLIDPEEISERHDIVECFVTDASLRADVAGLHLRGLPDLERLARKLERQSASLQDLCQLYRASSRVPLIEGALRGYSGPHAEKLIELFAEPLKNAHDSEHLTKFEELLEAAVDLDRIPDEYLIASTYDEGLAEIEEEKRGVEEEIQTLAEAAAEDLGLVLDKTVKLEWHKAANQRLRCLRITAKEEKTVRKKLQSKYIELETRKDGMKFTNRPLRQAAERLQKLSSDYDSRQATLVSQVVSVAATFVEVWERVASLLSRLDVLCAFADVAISAPRPYVRPRMLPSDANEITLIQCRHPCVEAQDGIAFIPNDARLKHGTSWFQLITGPNMGGKSTFIRQIGACIVMAQCGSFVPCDAATIAVRDAVYARVGAGDCQMRGVSTFMAEMLETASILKGATPRSLVIIDELGRGTSTWDGMGLAWAISEHLMKEIGCPTLFATHFHELTALRGEVGVENLHVKCAISDARPSDGGGEEGGEQQANGGGGLTMLYEVCQGSCDQSLGIHVAEFARFPPEVVDAARAKAEELERYQPTTATASGDKDGGEKNMNTKKRKKTVEEDEILRQALLKFANEPLDGLSEEELKAKASEWLATFERMGNGNGNEKKVAV